MNDTDFPNELGSTPLEGGLSGRKLNMSNLKGGLAEKGCKLISKLHPRHTRRAHRYPAEEPQRLFNSCTWP